LPANARSFARRKSISAFARMVPTKDIEEGISAWLDKHPPQFTVT
jgi:hypothetical protein